ncbi:uncharacterized [Tachysurus ichikawai]
MLEGPRVAMTTVKPRPHGGDEPADRTDAETHVVMKEPCPCCNTFCYLLNLISSQGLFTSRFLSQLSVSECNCLSRQGVCQTHAYTGAGSDFICIHISNLDRLQRVARGDWNEFLPECQDAIGSHLTFLQL